MTDTTSQKRPHVIPDAKGKRPDFYADKGVDQLMSMVMVLASELNVLRDRVDAQERVAKQHGLDLAAGIDMLKLDEKALEEREAWRQSFMSRLFYLARKEANEAATCQTRQGFNTVIEDIAKS